MVADRGHIALIKGLVPGGRISIKVTAGGVLTHTNHYTGRTLLKANELPARNSLRRLERINRLLAECPPPFSLDRFISLSEDRSGMQGDSILQACGPDRKVCTLATWVVSLPEDGFPELYVTILRPDYTGAATRLKLDAGFWTKMPPRIDP